MKIVISGYYGHGNFGDEAILQAIISELNKQFEKPQITALGRKPDFKAIMDCDIFISGGGSLFQDVTSLKSLIYYLGLLFFAVILGKKTVVYSQGMGPIKTDTGKFLLPFVLKKVKLITVRDKESAEFLEGYGVSSTVTADPVWTFDYVPIKNWDDRLKVGVQLRDWSLLDDNKLKALAESINTSFKGQNVLLSLISLQDKSDISVLEAIKPYFKDIETKVIGGLTLHETIDCISNLDYLIAMRYHACLIAAKYSVPFLAISYDPKVKSLSKEANAPYVPVKDISFSMLSSAIKYLVSEKESIKVKLAELSVKKAQQATVNLINL